MPIYEVESNHGKLAVDAQNTLEALAKITKQFDGLDKQNTIIYSCKPAINTGETFPKFSF